MLVVDSRVTRVYLDIFTLEWLQLSVSKDSEKLYLVRLKTNLMNVVCS